MIEVTFTGPEEEVELAHRMFDPFDNRARAVLIVLAIDSGDYAAARREAEELAERFHALEGVCQ